MADLVYTFVADGPSDSRLMRAIDWCIGQNSVEPITGQFADPRAIVSPSRRLPDRIPAALEAFPCDLLVVHRDAEAQDFRHRENEIREAVNGLCPGSPPSVVLVPIRMQEAWLLFDEAAIRDAAGNPNGTTTLPLPALRHLETIADPKEVLADCLRKASDLRGRRLRKFSENRAAARLSELIADYSPLRSLSAFARFEQSLRDGLDTMGIAA